MSTSTPANAKPLFVGLLVLFALLAILLVLKLVSWLMTVAVTALVIVGLYEGFRVVTLMRGLTPPPSSIGLVRAVGHVGLAAVRVLPALANGAGRVAYVAAHSTHEIMTGAVLGGLVGLAAGWHLGSPLIGTLLGLGGGVALGLVVGRRRLRGSAAVIPPARSPTPGS